ncbi:hypothetical protein CON64_10225 [Bacillus pseudomycoides]|nr:hypothetical protein CON64_10225 [Bacillus pseudomycoides]
MKLLQNKHACIGITANLIFFKYLYIFLTCLECFYMYDANDLDKSEKVELTYIFFALLVPLGISNIYSYIALRKQEKPKWLITTNLAISITFTFFTSFWYITIFIIYVYI